MSEVKISARDVAELRKLTGAGMMDCKKALVEANGDIEAAQDILRKKGQKLSAKRADREANEGVIIAQTSDDGTKGIIVHLSCETDFVAKNQDFINLTQELADLALKHFPGSLDELKTLTYNEELTIGEKVTEQVGVIGEKIELANFKSLEAPMVVSYIHAGYKRGVLVGLSQAGDYREAGKGVAMQVAAMGAVAVDKGDVDQATIDKEIEIGKEQARLEGKPEAILEKIAMGKLNKFYKEKTLLNQEYVRGENKETVGQFLKNIDKDLTVTAFHHVALGG